MRSGSQLQNPRLQAIVPFAMAILLAFVPLVLGKFVLDMHARQTGTSEVEAIANRFLGRAERTLTEAVATLRDVDRAGHRACIDADRIAYGEAVSGTAFLKRVGVVDRNGNSMCVEPPSLDRRRALLPALQDRDMPVVVSVLDPESGSVAGTPSVMVGWRSYDGTRLIAEIQTSALDVDAGPAYLLEGRKVEVLIDGTKPWLTLGRRASDAPGELLSADIKSELFPVRVVVTTDLASAHQSIRDLDLMLTVASVAVFFVFIALAFWLNRRPDSDFDDEFEHGLRNHEFVPYYQPVMNIESGQVEGCEVLVRWVRADGTVIAPGQFMPYAETSGHVFPLTRQLMIRSAREVGPLYRKHPNLKLSINLFAGHFDDRQIIEDIVTIFGPSEISYDQLVFEVTERYPLKDLDRARKLIGEMHNLGCRVALDDTGTGHGGLAYIQQLGIDIIKIDKMFIDAMVGDLGAARIVDVLVELANSLGMGIVAEGIEHDEQIDKLREKGVTAAQGYIFAPPLPANLFLELVESLIGERTASSEGFSAMDARSQTIDDEADEASAA